MEVKSGYKLTEIGVIPADWDHLVVGDVAKVKGGKRLPFGYFLIDRPTAHPYVRVSDMYPGGIDRSAIRYVPNQAFPAVRNYRIYSDDIFISVAGTLGIVGVVPPELHGANLTENADRITAIQCDRDYLMYWLMSPSIQQTIESIRTVGAQPKLALGRIARFDIAVPRDPAEQTAISAVLSDVDDLIASLTKLLAKKRALKQAAMQRLLTGAVRLPGFSGEWETRRLGDIGEISSAGVDKKSRRGEPRVRLVNYLDVYRRDIILSHHLHHTVTAPPQQLQRCAVRRGDVFFTPSSETPNDIGHSAVALESIPDAAYSYHVVRLRLEDPWDVRFRAYAFKSKHFMDQARILGDGSGTRYVISQGKFRDMTVWVPPLPEQAAIAAVLSEMDDEIAALEARLAKTRAIKQGMAQELLTGRTRLV